MFSKYILPLLAVLGFSFGIYSVVQGNQPMPIAKAAAEPANSPYPAFIAGAGIVEAKSQNIAIGTPLGGIVAQVLVKVGDKVPASAPLFRLDEREAQAEAGVRRANLAKAKATVGEVEASVTDTKTLLALVEAVTDRRAISTEELDRRRNAHLIAKARLDSARAQVLQAEAELAAAQTTVERLVVRAPVEGMLLQVNVRPGEFAQAGAGGLPLMILGNLDQLHIRVDIDENDAWRFRKEGRAVAYMRGNSQFKTELRLVWVEPYVIPKRSLTGDSTERVDTRVLQALYSFDRATMPAYVGQQMDVFIEAADNGGTPPAAKPGAKS
ncbi:MAG: efflux RND transporter periplasmic adaptor subunit [Candidatus Methylumidiphilus sp.]